MSRSKLRPYEEDSIVIDAAKRINGYVTRYIAVDVDEKNLPSEYWRRVPDYAKIRRSIGHGINVPGATKTDLVEYVIRHRDEPQEDEQPESISEK